eukprot:1671910-Pyramimonas_sp.AAC.1
MTHGRLILVDECSELERRKSTPGLKDRSQAASRRELGNDNMISWSEFLALDPDSGGGGGVVV